MTIRPGKRDRAKLSKFDAVTSVEGCPTLATVVRDDLRHAERYTPEYRAWLEARAVVYCR